MPSILGHLAVAAALTLVIGLVSGGGWEFAVGAAYAAVLWLILLCGSLAVSRGQGRGRVEVTQYAIAAALAVAIGWAMFVVGDKESVWWSVGIIVAGVLVPAGTRAMGETGTGSRSSSDPGA